MKKYNTFEWIVLALCLISFARGVDGLGNQSLWWDESLSHYRATRPFSFILSNRIDVRSRDGECPTLDNHPPLYFVLLRLVVLAAGDSEFALRFLSTAAGVLVVAMLYRCGRTLLDRWSGALAALLGTLSPLYLWYQQEARPYTLATLWGILSFYALIRALRAGSRARWGVIYVLSVAAMLTTHYFGFLLLAAEGVVLIFAWSQSRRWVWLPVATGVVAVLVFMWGLTVMPRAAHLPGYDFLPLSTLFRDVLHAFTLGLSADTLVAFRWCAVALLGLAIIVLFVPPQSLTTAERASGSVVALWVYPAWLLICFVLPVLGMFLLSLRRPAYLGVRHLMFASPFYYLVLGGGVARSRRLTRWRAPALAAMGAALGIVIVGMLLSSAAYASAPEYDKEDHRGWGRYLSEHVRAEDMVLVVPALVFDLYEYYAQTDAPWMGMPLLCLPRPDTVAQLESMARAHDRLWVAFSSTPAWANVGNVPLKWLEKHATRTHFVQFDSSSTVVQVYGFQSRATLLDELPQGAFEPALNFDDQIHLVGMGVGEALSGHTLQLSLYWTAAQALARDYRMTLSLGDDRGFSWAALDYAPCYGACPTSEWPQGRIVRDAVDLEIPPGVPPGRYRLYVSVYAADASAPALAARSLRDDKLLGLIVPAGEALVALPDEPVAPGDVSMARTSPHRYGALALLGHNEIAGAYRPGDVLALSLYWQAARQPRREARFALQLVDADERVWARRDIAVSAAYPLTRWRKGDVVWAQHRFRIPVAAPPGEYRLYLAPADGGLWPWGDRREVLGALTIEPRDDRLVFDAPSMQHELRVNLDDQIELLGYDLAWDTVRPGGVVSCTLYWRALQEITQNYTVFNHLVAADGQTWGQWDNQPQHGALPTTRWAPGQVVADPYQIPLSGDAPGGTLQLWSGMYDAVTMTRLPLRDERGQVVGDHVVVVEIDVESK